jgi:hypothetical protein
MHFPRSRAAVIFSALLGLQLSVHRSALAATDVQGQTDSVELNATNATIKEILDALATSYKVTYQIPRSLQGDLTFHRSGTLREILERTLYGNDYFLKVLDDDSIEVVVLGISGGTTPASTGAAAVTAGAAAAPTAAAASAAAVSSAVIAAGNNANPPARSASPATGPVLPDRNAPPPLAAFLHQEPIASNNL